MKQQNPSDLLLHPSYPEHHLYATKAASRQQHLKDVKNADCETKLLLDPKF